MGKQITIDIYSRRILERSKGIVRAVAYTNLETPAKHRCSIHGKFTLSPKVALYQGTTPCPECRSATKVARTNDTKKIKRATRVKEYLNIITRAKILKIQATLQELLDAPCTTAFKYTCLGCGRKDNQSTLGQAARNRHGCRTCTNKMTNALKIRTPKTLLLELRAKYPGVTILGVARKPGDSGTKHAKIKFECTTCAIQVTRSLWPFVNPIAIHKCASCTAHHVATSGKSTSSQIRTFRHLKSGKAFKVQGSYEPLAIRILVREGIKVSALKPAQDIKPVEYHFLGKDRFYLPDLQYRKTIVEVKSDYTAGLKTEGHSFAMLKAKAKAVERSGFTFRLMLFKSTGKGKPPRLVEVPENWLRMSRSAMVRFFESA